VKLEIFFTYMGLKTDFRFIWCCDNCRIRVSALCRLVGRVQYLVGRAEYLAGLVEFSNSDLSREILNSRFVNHQNKLKFLQQVLDIWCFVLIVMISVWKSIVRAVFYKGSLRLGCW